MAAKPWIVTPLQLPTADKTYTIPPVGYDDGLTLITISDGGKTKDIDAKTPESVLFALVVGPAWDEMKADGQPHVVMHRAGMAALEYQLALVMGLDCEDAAALGEAIWESGLSPEAMAAEMAAYQKTSETPAPSTASKRSTSTASAPKTRSRASTRATTSPRATPRTPAKKAAPPSPGTR